MVTSTGVNDDFMNVFLEYGLNPFRSIQFHMFAFLGSKTFSNRPPIRLYP